MHKFFPIITKSFNYTFHAICSTITILSSSKMQQLLAYLLVDNVNILQTAFLYKGFLHPCVTLSL